MIKHNFRCPAFSPFPLWLMPPLPASAPLLVPLPLWPPIHPNLRSIQTCGLARLLQHCRKSHPILISSVPLFLFSCQVSLFCPFISHRFLVMSPLSTHIFIFHTYLSPLMLAFLGWQRVLLTFESPIVLSIEPGIEQAFLRDRQRQKERENEYESIKYIEIPLFLAL